MLIMHGTADAAIPRERSVQMHRRCRELSVDSELVLAEGKGHGWFNGHPDFMPTLRRIEEFLRKYFSA